MQGVTLGVVLCLALLCIGCRGERMNEMKKALKWVLESTDTTVVLRVRAGAHRVEERQWLRSINRIRVWLREPGGSLLDEIDIVPALSGMATQSGEHVSLLLEGEGVLRRPPSGVPARLIAEYRIEVPPQTFHGAEQLQRHHFTGALLLVPDVEVRDGDIVFSLRVRRLRVVEGEYFPTSERLRVELFQG
ncbi:MAG: hypothetical protein NZ949_05325, partial [Candidatus Kapabacteria bacterium]|nr:hypothetical protein [Candidatus Kapabacteria bacterium]MDW7997563.1 hypothetical protein [Bacteroidota bacterium]